MSTEHEQRLMRRMLTAADWDKLTHHGYEGSIKD